MLTRLSLNSLQVRLPLMMVAVVTLAAGLTAFFAQKGTAGVFTQYTSFIGQRDQRIVANLLTEAGASGQLTQAQLEQLGQSFGQPILLVSTANGDVLATSDPTQFNIQFPVPPPGTAPQIIFKTKPTYVMLSSASAPTTGVSGASGEPLDVFTWVNTAAYPPYGVAAWVAPLPESAVLVDELSPADSLQLFMRSINRSFLISVGAALALTTVLSVALSRRILNPVAALTAAARKMEKGDLTQRVAVQSQGEIGELAHAFNAMADGLHRADGLRRNLVSDVAHELRTPLANVRGYLEAMRDGVVAPDTAALNSIYEETLLLNWLIDDLQDLAQAEAGQLKLARQPASPAELVSAAVAAAGPQAAERGLILRADLAPTLPTLSLDTHRLGQALRNLTANAIAHTPAGGEVVVTAASTGGAVTLSVRDTGEGISPEHLPFVFDRFYRADASRSRATGGSGLGLAIVKQWVNAHGGSISVTSELGQGTTFTTFSSQSPIPMSHPLSSNPKP